MAYQPFEFHLHREAGHGHGLGVGIVALALGLDRRQHHEGAVASQYICYQAVVVVCWSGALDHRTGLDERGLTRGARQGKARHGKDEGTGEKRRTHVGERREKPLGKEGRKLTHQVRRGWLCAIHRELSRTEMAVVAVYAASSCCAQRMPDA